MIRLLLAGFLAGIVAVAAGAGKKYGPGVTDRVEAAYFRMINERGGINGRKISFISLDDGLQPPTMVEATHRLVEQDEVLPRRSSRLDSRRRHYIVGAGRKSCTS